MHPGDQDTLCCQFLQERGKASNDAVSEMDMIGWFLSHSDTDINFIVTWHVRKNVSRGDIPGTLMPCHHILKCLSQVWYRVDIARNVSIPNDNIVNIRIDFIPG